MLYDVGTKDSETNGTVISMNPTIRIHGTDP